MYSAREYDSLIGLCQNECFDTAQLRCAGTGRLQCIAVSNYVTSSFLSGIKSLI